MERKDVRKKNRKKGFTLVELMIVVAIIAILSAVAIPQFQKYRKRSAHSAVQHATEVALNRAAECIAAYDQGAVTNCDSIDVSDLESNQFVSGITVNVDVANGTYTVTATGAGLAEGYTCTGSGDSSGGGKKITCSSS